MKTSSILIYVIFFVLLLVLLPHTAWFFYQFESPAAGLWGVRWGWVTAGAAAAAFEATIAVFTHKLAGHLEQVGRRGKSAWPRFQLRYLNAYGLGLFVAWVISTVANYAHAVEFGQAGDLFAGRLPIEFTAILAGAILPFCSFLFARAISNLNETETDVSDAEQQLKAEIRELKADRSRLNTQLQGANQYAFLASPEKKQVIIQANDTWPELNQTALAVLAGASRGHVSDVLNSNGKVK